MKKHFVLLGKAGLIYFSWLFIVLFIGLIIAYEGTERVNWPAILIICLFVLLLVYTFINSYYSNSIIKLPYSKKIILKGKVQLVKSWRFVRIEKIKLSNLQTVYFLRVVKEK